MKIFTILFFSLVCLIKAEYLKQAEYDGRFSEFVTIGDADNDGFLEIYDPCYLDDSVMTIVREYQGFQFQAIHLDYYALPWDLGDINNNGLIDLVAQTGDPGIGGNGYLQIYEQKSPNQFPDSLIAQVVLPGVKITHFSRYADVDQDGKQEIIMSPNGWSGGGLNIYEWNDSLELVYSFPGNGYCQRKAISDFDNDGRLEIVYSDLDSIHVIKCLGDNSYQEVWHYAVEGVNSNGPTLALDFNGDGQDEFICCFSGFQFGYRYLVFGWNGSTYELLYNVGGPVVSGAGIITCAVGDYDLDGRDEFVAGIRLGQPGNSWPEVRIYDYNNGSIDYQILSQYPKSLLGAYTADFNQDNRPDIYLVLGDASGAKHVEFYSYQETAINEKQSYSTDRYLLRVSPTIGRIFNIQTEGTISLYSSDGRLIKKLFSGIHRFDLPNGVYWLKVEETQQTCKIVILK
jgi:hypothetical protein